MSLYFRLFASVLAFLSLDSMDLYYVCSEACCYFYSFVYALFSTFSQCIVLSDSLLSLPNTDLTVEVEI